MQVWSDWSTSFCVSESDDVVCVTVITSLLDMKVEELAYWMGKFVLEACKADGT